MRRALPIILAPLVLLVACEPEVAQEQRTQPGEVHIDTVLHPDHSASGSQLGPGEHGPTGRHQQSEVVPEAGQRSDPGEPPQDPAPPQNR